MTQDEIRERLATAVREYGWAQNHEDLPPTPGEVADALLPWIVGNMRRYAAMHLRDAAHHLDDGGDQAVEVALGGAAYVHRVLCDRAHQLDGES